MLEEVFLANLQLTEDPRHETDPDTDEVLMLQIYHESFK